MKWKLFTLSLFCTISLTAQDLHFSQFFNHAIYTSPGLVGVFDGDYRACGIYRSQWQSVPVDYRTFSAAFDTRLPVKILKEGYLSVGGILSADKAGDGEMQQIRLAGLASYTYPIGKQVFITAGVSLAINNRSFDFNLLSFDEQFDGELYNPNLGNGEPNQNSTNTEMDLGAGLNLRYQLPNTRTAVDVGLGSQQLSRPGASFFEDENVRRMMRINPYLRANIQVTPVVDIELVGQAQFQGPYRSYLSGGMVRYHLNTKQSKETSVALGTLTRFGDAVIPYLEIRYTNWKGAFTYDVNTSEFSIATNRRGGPEISLCYILKRPSPPPVFKACPIF